MQPITQHYWLKSGILSLSERVVSMTFNLGTAMLLLRMWSKEAFATWGLFIVLVYLVEMGRNGLLQNGLVRSLAAPKDKAAIPDIHTAALVINGVYSLVTNAITWAIIPWVCVQYQVPELATMMPAFWVANLVLALSSHCNFIQQAHLDFRGLFFTALFYRGIPFFWVLSCWIQHQELSLEAFSGAMLAGAAGATLVTFWLARPWLVFASRISGTWVRYLLQYGKYVLGTNLSTMLYKSVDKLTLGQLLGPAAFALYDAAGRLTQLVEAPAFSIAQVVFPRSAALVGNSGSKKLYEQSVSATLAIILPFVVFSLVFAEPMIQIFAGKAYHESAQLLRLTAFFGVFMPFAVQFGTLLDASGRPAINFAYTLGTAILNVCLSLLLIPIFGLFGAAYATLLGYSISFIFMQLYLYKHFRINALQAILYLPECYATAWGIVRGRFGKRD